MACEVSLYRSKWRAGSTIPFEIEVLPIDQVDLTDSDLILRFTSPGRTVMVSKSTLDGTILYTQQSASRLKAKGKVLPDDFADIVFYTRMFFALEITLPNGDEIPLTTPGQDWFDLYPEVGE